LKRKLNFIDKNQNQAQSYKWEQESITCNVKIWISLSLMNGFHKRLPREVGLGNGPLPRE
jgi:hypothetical protein